MLRALLLNPNYAFLICIVGSLAIYRELLSPGRYLPGVAGVFLLLAGAWGLTHSDLQQLSPWVLFTVGPIFLVVTGILVWIGVRAHRNKQKA